MADEKDIKEELKEKAAEAVERVSETVNETVSETVETAKEKTEELKDAIETAADKAQTAADTVVGQISEVDRAVAEAMAARDADEAAVKAKKNKVIKLVAIIAAAVIVVGGLVASGFASKNADGGIQFNSYDGFIPRLVNKYNHMGFVDSTGNTLGDITEQLGLDMSDFLETYGLPADMPKSTYEMVALYMMPAKNYAENICGIDFATLKEIVKIPDTAEDGTELTEDTEWYIVEGEIRIGDYINGDENFEQFKETFEITDESITVDSKWKDVRNMVDEYQKKQRIESEKAANDASDEAEDDVVDLDDVVDVEEVPADDTTAENETAEESAE